MSRVELTNYLVSRGWEVTHNEAGYVQLSRENYIEHMGQVYQTQDTIAYAEEVIGKGNVKVSRYPHYEIEVVNLALKMTA
jgi:hypothetical protein